VVPSIGVSSPSLTAVRTLLAALDASMASCISGKGKDIDLSLGAGAIRSIQRRRARPSPSSKLSIASLFLFLTPLGLLLYMNNGYRYFLLKICIMQR